MGGRQLVGAAVHRMAPRTVQALETVPVLAQQVQQLRAELADGRRRTAKTAGSAAEIQAALEESRVGRIGALEEALAEVESGLAESRGLSLRVAQMTDLVFDQHMTPR